MTPDEAIEMIRQWEVEARHTHGSARIRGCSRCEAHTKLSALGRNCILPLMEVADGYEQWEAAMLESQEAWAYGRRALPLLTQELWDMLLALQGQRNAALALVAQQVEKLKEQQTVK